MIFPDANLTFAGHNIFVHSHKKISKSARKNINMAFLFRSNQPFQFHSWRSSQNLINNFSIFYLLRLCELRVQRCCGWSLWEHSSSIVRYVSIYFCWNYVFTSFYWGCCGWKMLYPSGLCALGFSLKSDGALCKNCNTKNPDNPNLPANFKFYLKMWILNKIIDKNFPLNYRHPHL